MLPLGQLLWVKELESYAEFPPLQEPASYNLSVILQKVKERLRSSRASSRESRAS